MLALLCLERLCLRCPGLPDPLEPAAGVRTGSLASLHAPAGGPLPSNLPGCHPEPHRANATLHHMLFTAAEHGHVQLSWANKGGNLSVGTGAEPLGRELRRLREKISPRGPRGTACLLNKRIGDRIEGRYISGARP